jgi:23S rRNA pseudouridine2605 synthase
MARSKGTRSDPGRPAPARAARAEGVRLQSVIAAAGLTSRRAAEQWIRDGRVRVNGRVVRELGSRVDPQRDRVAVDGRPLEPAERRDYVLYKPRGVVSTARDANARRTVLELVPRDVRVFPVGRLDAASEGLLLLSSDGPLAHALLHPSFEVPRTYRASVDGALGAGALARLRAGVELSDGRTAPCQARLLRRDGERSVVELVLHEGRYRQIRRMLEALGHPVRRLVRTRFGPLALGGLAPGEWRALRPAERQALDALALRAARRQGTGSAPAARTSNKTK